MKTSYWVKHLLGSLVFFAILFISAGRLNYLPALIYVALGLIMGVLNYTVLAIDPELQKERSKPQEGTKKWDKAILGISFLLTIAMYIVGGFDSGRYHWSPEFPVVVVVVGIIFTGLGQFLFLLAQKQNRFFSSTVRIQTDRGHSVCDTGLYRIVRHPAYMGSIIQSAGFPMLFGSLWSILPVALLIVLFVTRTKLEDATLIKELKGYKDYSEKTRFKIIPYIW